MSVSSLVLALSVTLVAGCTAGAQADRVVNGKAIREFVKQFMTAIKAEDSKTFRAMVSADGLYSITYFGDGRDHNCVTHIIRDTIRDDLVLVGSDGIAGITIPNMFAGENNSLATKMPIQTSESLSGASFDVDWHTDGIDTVTGRLDDIVKTCIEVSSANDDFVPQVFVLKDNVYAFAKSAIDPPELFGDWVLFEKVGDSFQIVAVMQFE